MRIYFSHYPIKYFVEFNLSYGNTCLVNICQLGECIQDNMNPYSANNNHQLLKETPQKPLTSFSLVYGRTHELYLI